MRKIKVREDSLYRIIDANLNRAKEGLRVCEDICRFVLDDKAATKDFKKIRHQITETICSLKLVDIIRSRDIENDVGRQTTSTELKREKVADIFFANVQRVKESIRVLEEFLKLFHKETAQDFKMLRYRIYAVEKKVTQRF
ncbi:MAG: thiamine-phosphate pyrophosphorylase [Candidatus Omnitrophica bacterium]|nr:thiamine-phosphate pyrophosphorylase [Candidatus Omnitrophota bacterium]